MWFSDELVDPSRPELPVTALDPNQPLPDPLREGFLHVCNQVDQHDPEVLEAAVWVILAASKSPPTDDRCLRWLYAVSRGMCVDNTKEGARIPDRLPRYLMPRLCDHEFRHFRCVAKELRVCLKEVARLAGAAFMSLNDLKSNMAHKHIMAVANVVTKLRPSLAHSTECDCPDRLRARPELDTLTFVVFRLSGSPVAALNSCWVQGPLRTLTTAETRASPVTGALKCLAAVWEKDGKCDLLRVVHQKLDREICNDAAYHTDDALYDRSLATVRIHQAMSSAHFMGRADVATTHVLADILAQYWHATAPCEWLFQAQYSEILSSAADVLTLCRDAAPPDYWRRLLERTLRHTDARYVGVMRAIFDFVGRFEANMHNCERQVRVRAAEEAARGVVMTPPHLLYLSSVVPVSMWHYCHRWPSSAPLKWYEREHRIFTARHAHRRLPGVMPTYIEDVPVQEWPTQLPHFLGRVLHLNNLDMFCPPVLEMVRVNEPCPGEEFLVDCRFYSRTQHAAVMVTVSLKPLRKLNLTMLTDFFVHSTRFGRLPPSGLYEPSDFEEQSAPTEDELWNT